MPNFANPFQGNSDRKRSKEELIQAIRLDIAGELEAIYVYNARVQATDDKLAKSVIGDIRDEEKAHVGELLALLRVLATDEAEHLASGGNEVREMIEALGIWNIFVGCKPRSSHADAADPARNRNAGDRQDWQIIEREWVQHACPGEKQGCAGLCRLAIHGPRHCSGQDHSLSGVCQSESQIPDSGNLVFQDQTQRSDRCFWLAVFAQDHNNLIRHTPDEPCRET